MLDSIKRFMKDESGLETVEWAIVGGIIVVAGAGFFFTIGGDVKRGLGALDTETGRIPSVLGSRRTPGGFCEPPPESMNQSQRNS